MKLNKAVSLLAAAGLLFSNAAFAAGAKDDQVTGPVREVNDSESDELVHLVDVYQVTGRVLEVNDRMIAMQKGKDRWEILRDANTKASGEIKVGDNVIVYYTMTATSIEPKPAKK